MVLLLMLLFSYASSFFLFCFIKIEPIFTLLELEKFPFRVTVITRSLFVTVVILTPRISATSLNDRMVAIDFGLKCYVIGEHFRVHFLLKLFRPTFFDTVSLLWSLHVMIYFTKSMFFETLFVEHVSSSNHVCFIAAKLCVRVTPTCARLVLVCFGKYSE